MAWRQDSGSTHVLEAVILSIVLLGAAYSVTQLRGEAAANERPRSRLEDIAEDALTVLQGLQTPNGRALDHHLAESFHCAYHPTPSARDCDGTRGFNISIKLQNYLPAGAGYSYSVGNGVEERELYRSYLPEGEIVTASRTFVPTWNATFVVPELDCYDPTMPATVTLLPLRAGAIAYPTSLNLTAGSAEYGANVTTSGAWALTLDAPIRPADAVYRVNATSANATLPGVGRISTCALGAYGPLIVSALRSSTLSPVVGAVPLSQTAAFVYDHTELAVLSGVVLTAANLTVYAPLPARSDPGTYVPVHAQALSLTRSGLATWTVPSDSLYGIHPVVVSVTLDVSGTTVHAHRLTWVSVALPSGDVPLDPPYRVVLQAWFPDWK